MAKYEIFYTKKYKKSIKKLSKMDLLELESLIDKLANDEVLAKSYLDHPLKGDYLGFRELHVKPDLLLMYEKDRGCLVLTAVNVGSHSELFG